MARMSNTPKHSAAWIAQSWISFIVALLSTTWGILYLPMEGWAKGYMALSFAFTVSSTISISKTTRDMHESNSISAKVEEARVEKILATHSPLNTP